MPTIAFMVRGASLSVAEFGWIAAAGMLLLLPLRRRVRMVTLGAR
jgi:hypothetical protein